MNTEELAKVSHEIATDIRTRIPRSYNRIKENGPNSPSTWLKTIPMKSYAAFIGNVTRMSVNVNMQAWGNGYVFNKSLLDLKVAIEDFVKNGKVGTLFSKEKVDLAYQGNSIQEKEYTTKFFDALAKHLNSKGFLWGKEKAKLRDGNDAWKRAATAVEQADRLNLFGKEKALGYRGSDLNLQFPITYIRAQAKGAFRFKVGNCEECACAAFAMFLIFQNKGKEALGKLTTDIRMELVWARPEKSGSTHFFVLLNRKGTGIAEDFKTWIDHPDVVVCDPWISDKGVGCQITKKNEDMGALREYLLEDGVNGPRLMTVRAIGTVGSQPGELKNINELFL